MEEDAVVDFLFEYRVTPHPATSKAPADLLMGGHLRTTLDIVRSEIGTIPFNR